MAQIIISVLSISRNRLTNEGFHRCPGGNRINVHSLGRLRGGVLTVERWHVHDENSAHEEGQGQRGTGI